MTLSDLIRRFRVLANDKVEPYFWADQDVADWLNDAEAQAAIRGRLLRDDSTSYVCRIDLYPTQHTYPLSPKLIEIINLRITNPAYVDHRRRHFMQLVSREWLDAVCPLWRDLDEPSSWAIQNDTSIRIVGKIEPLDMLEIECYRLPLFPMEMPIDAPEIHEAHHEHLIQWALHKAFSIPDTESFDPQRSDRALQAFTAYFGLLPDSDLRRITREDVVHHNTAVLP